MVEQEVLRAMLNLQRRQDANFDRIVKWMESLKKRAETQIRVESDQVAVRMLQGKLQLLSEILDTYDQAEERYKQSETLGNMLGD